MTGKQIHILLEIWPASMKKKCYLLYQLTKDAAAIKPPHYSHPRWWALRELRIETGCLHQDQPLQGTVLVVQWLGLCPSTARAKGLILQVTGCPKKKDSKIERENRNFCHSKSTWRHQKSCKKERVYQLFIKNIHVHFIAALFTIARGWEPPKCPWMDKRVDKMQYRHSLEP